MPNGSGEGGATEALADHLGSLIDNLANFRNKVDLPRREGLLGALQQAQQEAAAKGIRIPLGSSVATVAQALVGLRSAGAVLDAVGVRELPGPGVYEAGDPSWAESLLNYAKTAVLIDSGKRPIAFPTHSGGIEPVKRLVPVNEGNREIKIAVVGDYGTGDFKEMPSPAARIGEFIREQQPDYTIHLGDVYYAGLSNEEGKFLGLWPGEQGRSYTLNSNHEMYCGGEGYFRVLLADPRFQAQQGLSYFALVNDQWLVLGLDTAFFGFRQSLLYEQGVLADQREKDGTVQIEWLKKVIAQNRGKRVIVLTHHDGFDVDPFTGKVSTKPLYNAVVGELSNVKDWFWYWGHVHTVIVYDQIQVGNSNVSTRCVGHGGIPYAPFPADYARLGDAQVKVKWAETRLAGNGGNPNRAPNGYMLLTLSGRDIEEELYDELGKRCWPNK